MMKIFANLLLFAFLALPFNLVETSTQGQENANYPPGDWQNIIENVTFNETLSLNEDDDHTLIIGVVFENIDGDAIKLRDVSNVYIKDCIIRNIDGSGIVLRSAGSTQNITIDGCQIENTTGNGIIAKQRSDEGVDHKNLVIKNNTVFNNGEDRFDHNIYVQASDSIIENNIVHDSFGNGISIRSSGIVRGNYIWDTEKSCIRYFSDHKNGLSDLLIIENNLCFLKDIGSGNPGISLLVSAETSLDWIINNIIIRFNTVVISHNDRFGILVESFEFDKKYIEVYGNLVIHTMDLEKSISKNYIDYFEGNLVSNSFDIFLSVAAFPYHLSLFETSLARGYVNRVIGHPEFDFLFNYRNPEYLDDGVNQTNEIIVFNEDLDQNKDLNDDQVSVADSPTPLETNEKSRQSQKNIWRWELILIGIIFTFVSLMIIRKT